MTAATAVQQITLRVPAHEPFREGETPATFARRHVAKVVAPAAIEWSVSDITLSMDWVDVTRFDHLLRHRKATGGEWQITYETVTPENKEAS
jgi:hypothetical protein